GSRAAGEPAAALRSRAAGESEATGRPEEAGPERGAAGEPAAALGSRAAGESEATGRPERVGPERGAAGEAELGVGSASGAGAGVPAATVSASPEEPAAPATAPVRSGRLPAWLLDGPPRRSDVAPAGAGGATAPARAPVPGPAPRTAHEPLADPAPPPTAAAEDPPEESPVHREAERRAAGAAVDERWAAIVAAVHEERAALAAVLEHAAPLEVGPARITLAFPLDSFHGRQAASPEARQALARLAGPLLGEVPDVKVVVAREDHGAPASLADQARARHAERKEAARAEALAHPLVKQATALFGVRPESLEVRVDGE
ncbi:MAG: hypothetical protein ACFCGT_28330, partial [Sandaracinaceae bacterium]